MWALLDLVPRWAWLAALAAAAALLAITQARLVHARGQLQAVQLQLASLKTTIADERAAAGAAAREASERFRAEQERSAIRNQEITDETVKALSAAGRADGRAAAAGDGLRQRAATVAARCDRKPEAASLAVDGEAAAAAGAVLADVLGRLDEAGRQLAAAADARGIAGTDCQRRYESLSVQ